MPRTQPTVLTLIRPASLILVLTFSLCVTLSHGAGDPRIVVTSPTPNTVVRPGASLPVRVEVDPSLQPAAVTVIAPLRTKISPLAITTAPYEGTLLIPNDLTGNFELDVGIKTIDDKSIDGPLIPISVIPDETPARIEAERWFMLRLPKNPGDPLPDQEGTRTISVFGFYANNIRRVIGGAMFGTTYASSNPTVATVNADGVITPVAPGIAFITVEHKGLKAFSKVTIEPLTGSDLPSIDQTVNVAIQASGFRLDRTEGRYIQQLTITNKAALPLPGVVLVLFDLPNGVNLANADGRTRVITPLESPWRFTEFNEPYYLSPGNSFTVTLEFFNRYGVPITYTPKLYTATRP